MLLFRAVWDIFWGEVMSQNNRKVPPIFIAGMAGCSPCHVDPEVVGPPGCPGSPGSPGSPGCPEFVRYDATCQQQDLEDTWLGIVSAWPGGDLPDPSGIQCSDLPVSLQPWSSAVKVQETTGLRNPIPQDFNGDFRHLAWKYLLHVRRM